MYIPKVTQKITLKTDAKPCVCIYIYIIVVKVYQYCWLYIPSTDPLSQPGTVEAVAVARAVAGASLDVTGATVPALLADALLMDALSTSDEGTCPQNLCDLGGKSPDKWGKFISDERLLKKKKWDLINQKISIETTIIFLWKLPKFLR